MPKESLYPNEDAEDQEPNDLDNYGNEGMDIWINKNIST